VAAVDLVSGERGFGESVPREYVTGETIESALAELKRCAPGVFHPTFISPASLIEYLSPFPEAAGDHLRVEGNAARCALELALLDAGGKHFHKSVSQLLGLPESASISLPRYSGVISADTPGAATWSAIKMRLFGFPHIKVKVGLSETGDIVLVHQLRQVLGRRKDIRLDANGAWTLDLAATMITAFADSNVSAVEQPLPKGDVAQMAELRKRVKVPLMLDESLCTLEDARKAADAGGCDLFNIRISKCGGMLPSLKIAEFARERKLGFQIGCQVGETGILSAAGRHLAALLPDAKYLEGSYDRFLLANNLTERHVSFGYGGRARPLTAPGLGVEVSETALNSMSVSRIDLHV
jgi:muconate cycloisomerase